MKNFSANNEDNIKRAIDLACKAERESVYVFSDFLTEAEQSEILRISPRLPVGISLNGGYEGAERKVVRFGSVDELGYEERYPISILKISPVSEKFGEELTHRDYLGAVLNLGIDRRVTGDILINGKTAWIFCLDHIANYLADSLTRVRHTNVRTEPADGLPPTAASCPAEIYAFVASLRIDAVMCRAFRMSRTEAQRYLAAEKVFVNSVNTVSSSHILKPGDKVSVRGRGKFIFAETDKRTKKGNLRIRLEIY